MSFGTEFLSMVAPPREALKQYDRTLPPSQQPNSIPEVFIEAMTVREQVFVEEQKVPLENELDADDERSFHWVVYASVGTSGTPEPESRPTKRLSDSHRHGSHSRHNSRDEERRKSSSTALKVPVGTIRLVPPPHPPHPAPGSHHKIDNSEDARRRSGSAGSGASSSSHDGEAYVKLGRLAVLPKYRGLGLSRLLVNAALNFAQANPEQIAPAVDPAETEKRRLEGREVREWSGRVLVHAQTGVEAMWERVGFRRDDDMGVWDEEGIDHIGMWRQLKVKDLKPTLSYQM